VREAEKGLKNLETIKDRVFTTQKEVGRNIAVAGGGENGLR